MTTTETPRRSEPLEDPQPGTCPRCGSPLRPEQDWCLNCGAAVTTEVAGAPGWRTPIAIVGAVLLLAAIGLVFAFVRLSDNANQAASVPQPTAVAPAAPAPAAPTAAPPVPTPAPPAATATPAPPAATATPAPGATPAPATGAVPTWPAGKTAYTVIYWSAATRPEAEAKAKAFQAGGATVGILHSNDFSSLRAGYWVVFSGQYDTQQAAQAAATAAQAKAPGAYAKQVRPK
jgi:hypothetical protein